MRVGVEVGGTFTDLVAVEADGVVVTKVPSTPQSPDIGAFAALTASGIDIAPIEDLGHGSTVATNAVLERKGARGRLRRHPGLSRPAVHAAPRPAQHLRSRSTPSRRRRCAARTASRSPSASAPTARSRRRSTKPKVRGALIPALKAGGYRAVAICLLNAYANPAHEQRAARR